MNSGLHWITPGRTNAGGPLEGWVTDALEGKRAQLREFLRVQQLTARDLVRMRSHVDTGRMRSEVDSFFFDSPRLMGIDFGWWEGNPQYAPYQEFGVPSHNIEPMRAVQRTYHELWGQLKTEVAR